MEFLLILLAIVWVVVPIAAKNSQQKAKAEAERLRAARANAPQTAAVQQRVQQPMRTAPLTPNTRAPMQASSEGTGSDEGNFTGSLSGTSRRNATFNTQEARSTLTEANTSITHTVSMSSESGHAHEETSASGVAENCPPDKASSKTPATPAKSGGESAFVWNAAAVRNGLVMAEILGPCLANRD